jgi:DNA polymerase elongation subunit (family B)
MRSFVNGFVDGNRVVLLYREAGKLLQYTLPAELVAFLPANADDIRPGCIDAVKRDSRVAGCELRGRYWRVRFRDRWERTDLCKAFRTGGMPVFEGDVDPLRRCISDHDLHVAKPRRLFFDIEADSRVTFREATEFGLARILVIGAADEEGGRFQWVLDADPNDEAAMDAAEAQMLREFIHLCEGYDQIVAWNGDGYDFPALEHRCARHRVAPREWRRWLWLDHMAVFEKMNKNGAESGEEKTSLSLQAVGMALLGHGKDDFDASKTWEAWVARDPVLPAYNAKDVELMLEIEAKNGYLGLFQSVCEACRVFGNSRGLLPTQQMDGFMLRLGVERDYHFATRFFDKDTEDGHQFRGAFVLHPTTKGVLRGVHVGDFAAMYPANIVTWNLSPETKIGPWEEGAPVPEGVCVTPTTRIAFSTKELGILPFAITELIRLRKVWRDKVKEYAPGTDEAIECMRKSTAYKVVANSFYGVMGSKYSRFYDEEIAEAVTQTGVWLIKHTMANAEGAQWGMNTVYGDTDSLMIRNAPRAKFEEFVQWCNRELYPDIIGKTGARMEWCIVKLEYEKMYRRIAFGVDDKGDLIAKRYCACYEHYKGKDADASSKPEVKGYEWRRGDWNVLARTLQRDAIMLFVNHDTPDPTAHVDLVLKVREHILKDAIPLEAIQITKSIGKPLAEYKVKEKKDGGLCAQPPHIELAKRMLAEGKEIREGIRIAYVILDGSNGIKAIPAAQYTGEFDRFYLWEKSVYPATMRFLMAIFPDYDWKQYLKVRPKKERAPRAPRTGSRATEPEAIVRPSARLATSPDAPVVVRVPRELTLDEADTLEGILLRFPGRRPVAIDIPLVGRTQLPATVSVTPAMLAAVQRFESGITIA